MDDDLGLLQAWCAGDRQAAASLIERHFDAVARFFSTKAGAEADDLVQRVFLRCTESAATFRRESSFRSYLFGIARNVLLEHIRSRVRGASRYVDLGEASIADLAPGVATAASQRAEQRVLIAALQQIPLELQMLLELFYWEELSVGEVAEVLELPAGTIKSRLHRARGLLREAMERVSGGPEERLSAAALLDGWAADLREKAGRDD